MMYAIIYVTIGLIVGLIVGKQFDDVMLDDYRREELNEKLHKAWEAKNYDKYYGYGLFLACKLYDNMRYLAIVLWPIVLIVLYASCLYVKIKWR